MKRIFTSALVIMLLLSSCAKMQSNNAETTLDSQAIISENLPTENYEAGKFETGIPEGGAAELTIETAGMSRELNGMYYFDSFTGHNRLSFLDYKTMNSVVVCSRPNCLHDDPETCSAFGFTAPPAVFGKNLYFFKNLRKFTDNGGFNVCCELWRADLDGSNRIKLETVNGGEYTWCGVKGGSMYILFSEEVFEDGGRTSKNYYKERFAVYGFETGKLTDIGEVSEGYPAGFSRVIGEYNGAIYYLANYTNEYYSFGDDYLKNVAENDIVEIKKLDLKTLEICDADVPCPGERQGLNGGYPDVVIAGDGYYVIQDGDAAHIFLPGGEQKVIEDYHLTERAADRIINGIIFNCENCTALELKTGKIYELNKSSVYGRYVLAYCDGEYIMAKDFMPEQSKKVTAEELFKEAE